MIDRAARSTLHDVVYEVNAPRRKEWVVTDLAGDAVGLSERVNHLSPCTGEIASPVRQVRDRCVVQGSRSCFPICRKARVERPTDLPP